MSERITAQGVDLRTIMPPRALRVEGVLTLNDDEKDEFTAIARGLREADPARGWASCEEEAALQHAQDRLGSTGLEVEEAEPL